MNNRPTSNVFITDRLLYPHLGSHGRTPLAEKLIFLLAATTLEFILMGLNVIGVPGKLWRMPTVIYP